jgi:hypothetical protein
MKQIASLVLLVLGSSLAHAGERAPSPQASRMSVCQKEATASGKKGDERKAVLRACMSAGKAGDKGMKAG